ncbi:LAQU0S02e01618g1_1 [Lachancea quebecensis]|uniref:LAQU0S02e01618g1_1 n=1 Tax=Lachancea quebecensis TaxID=1654605 RepID=A0A0P1KN10_9SACH|nr:LAQU0S02e01618g1_1 [Lachancea quebecensis]
MVMDKFIERGRFTLVYPVVLICGLVLHSLTNDSTLQHQKDSHYLLSPNNIINLVFAYKGNLIWTILFASLAAYHIRLRISSSDLLPRDARTTRPVKWHRLGKEYMVKLIVKNLLLCVVFFVIDRVFVWTGGSCSSSATKSAEQCRKEGGKWENGFDISGHFCFLTNVSLILWLELSSIQKQFASNERTPSKVWCVLLCLNVFVLTIWAFILSVTAIYYHTTLEKILGLLMGYICPIVMYWLIPSHTALRHLLY